MSARHVSFKIRIEFLTPCFLGGPEPASDGEFRLASLKGLLRYWWRQFQDQSNSSSMFRKESKIFGSRENRSGFSLYELDRSELCFDRYGNGYKPTNSGESYLFFSCIPRHNQPGRKNWIKEGSVVTFAISFASVEDEQVKETLLSLWLLQTFGGLGSRSRRGAGSFQVKVQDAPADINTWVQKLFNSQATDLIKVINDCTCDKDERFQFIKSKSPIYVNLKDQNHFRQFRPMAFIDSTSKILDQLGQQMRAFRSCFTYNYISPSTLHKQAAALHQAGLDYRPGSDNTYRGPKTIEKTAFGLPIIFNFKKRNPNGALAKDEKGKQIFEDWRITLRPVSHERRASPLFISVKKDLISNKYYANLLILWGSFLPENEPIAIIYRRRGNNNEYTLGNLMLPTARALEEFLRNLK